MSKREPKHMGEVMSDIAERYDKLTKTKMSKEKKFDKFYKRMRKELNEGMNKEELIENILDIINSENSGWSHQQRLNEIEKLVSQYEDE